MGQIYLNYIKVFLFLFKTDISFSFQLKKTNHKILYWSDILKKKALSGITVNQMQNLNEGLNIVLFI